MSAYGFCPICGGAGSQRERRPNGNDTCVNSHTYPSASAVHALVTPISKSTQIPFQDDGMEGPLVIAVVDHARAEGFADLLGLAAGPKNQGVRVIPFAASALAYCGRDARLFRGLVLIPPRAGSGGISREAFDHWVASSITPYMAPNAPRIVL